ncbi:hypothetical protein BaRGS_00002215, partial [Batillaria attramentaria]
CPAKGERKVQLVYSCDQHSGPTHTSKFPRQWSDNPDNISGRSTGHLSRSSDFVTAATRVFRHGLKYNSHVRFIITKGSFRPFHEEAEEMRSELSSV